MTMNIIERLERHALDMIDGECWITDLVPNSDGYPQLCRGKSARLRVNRLAWEAHHAEPIPPGLHVLHTCDNPACFNPEHLFLGTNQDNIDDKCRKGRQRGVSSQQAFARSQTRTRNSQGQFT